MTITLDSLVRAHGRSAREVLNERSRAALIVGHTPEDDDKLTNRQLVHKAIERLTLLNDPVPSDQRKLAIEAAGLLLAEIERIDRAVRLEGAQAHAAGVSIVDCLYDSNNPLASVWREGWLASIDGERKTG